MTEPESRMLLGGEMVAGDEEPLAVENPFSESTVATKHVHVETEIAAKDWWYPYSGENAGGHPQ